MRWKRQLRRSYWFNHIQNLTKCRLIIYQSIPTREEFICSRFQWWLFSAGLHLCMFGNRCHNITHLMHISAHLINPSLSQKRSKLYSSDLIRQFRFVICKNICWFGQKLSDLLFFWRHYVPFCTETDAQETLPIVSEKVNVYLYYEKLSLFT